MESVTMTDNQARRIEMLLAAHLAVSTETMLLVSLGTMLGGRGFTKQSMADVFMKKAAETKALMTSVLLAARDDREHETTESAAHVEAMEAALEDELNKPAVGFKF
jgi:hypothetical protein